ncbi:hypothetical protein [Defluviimonas sp. WL0075]|uniref:Uncharacterized protein n=1 Tax=Albidovulum sediminicola TaxID=2984331 RepID=A0ABT2Z5R8_9RHOB|nr:hypothetical protein [Defluviimonas sp. WL0075]MCV2866347.1 hypothetical protein [Defluviimonas sp. WL0075]
MSALRDEIRAILREEIAALRADAAPAAPQTERIRIGSSAELNRFAQDLLRRAASPEFAARVMAGDHRFDLEEGARVGAAYTAPIVTGPARTPPGTIDKALITERDIAALGNGVRSLRLGPQNRLTPLARDEARRRGIRIERADR